MNVKPVPKSEPRPRRAGGAPADSAHSTNLSAPSWATQWAEARPRVQTVAGFSLAVSEGQSASLVSVRLAGARRLGAAAFERKTVEAYRLIHSTVAALRHGHPVRFWNFLPGIHQLMKSGGESSAGTTDAPGPTPPRDRYMVFNAGRYQALSDWFGGPGRLPGSLPAASAVGHDGDDFAVHCLLLAKPGVAVENPRQVPAFRYSARYGPKPPCFARATVVPGPRDGAPTLLAAGTASILGEHSVHVGDLAAQLAETLANLRALVGAAMIVGAPPSDPVRMPVTPGQSAAQRSAAPDPGALVTIRSGAALRGCAAALCPGVSESAEGATDHAIASAAALDAFTHIRVYHVRPQDAAEIDSAVRTAFPAARVEAIRAELCRADLLVEIEGVACLAEASDRKGG